MKVSIIILALILIPMMSINISAMNTSVIHGSIYDLILNKESNVVVEINTIPKQTLISKDGDYSFNVPTGNYTIYAYTRDAFDQENISVNKDGDYTIDLVLELGIEKPEHLDVNLTTPNTDLIDARHNNNLLIVWIIILIIIIIAAVLLVPKLFPRLMRNVLVTPDSTMHVSPKPIEDDEYGQKVLKFIKSNKRTTQKELRKNIPLSEGKISLIVSELEIDGKIRKIKKGRGNILIYVKD